MSLKNGVNQASRAWANLTERRRLESLDLVDDKHRALVYQFFDAAVHPAYAVMDHCMRYRALLPSIAETLNGTASDASANGGLGGDLVSVVEALLRETETETCTDDAANPVSPAGARVTAQETAHVPGRRRPRTRAFPVSGWRGP